MKPNTGKPRQAFAPPGGRPTEPIRSKPKIFKETRTYEIECVRCHQYGLDDQELHYMCWCCGGDLVRGPEKQKFEREDFVKEPGEDWDGSHNSANKSNRQKSKKQKH